MLCQCAVVWSAFCLQRCQRKSAPTAEIRQCPSNSCAPQWQPRKHDQPFVDHPRPEFLRQQKVAAFARGLRAQPSLDGLGRDQAERQQPCLESAVKRRPIKNFDRARRIQEASADPHSGVRNLPIEHGMIETRQHENEGGRNPGAVAAHRIQAQPYSGSEPEQSGVDAVTREIDRVVARDPLHRVEIKSGQALKMRQRAGHQRVQIAFDESKSRAARQSRKRQIGDAQPPRDAGEERERDDRQCLRQFLDRRTGQPRGRHDEVEAGILDRSELKQRYLLQQKRQQRSADAAIAEKRQEAAEGQRDAAAYCPALQENGQEEQQQTETGPEGKHVQSPLRKILTAVRENAAECRLILTSVR